MMNIDENSATFEIGDENLDEFSKFYPKNIQFPLLNIDHLEILF